jgi:hypothetical protein
METTGAVVRTRSGPIDYPREKPKNPKGLLNRAALSCDARKLVADELWSTFFRENFRAAEVGPALGRDAQSMR